MRRGCPSGRAALCLAACLPLGAWGAAAEAAKDAVRTGISVVEEVVGRETATNLLARSDVVLLCMADSSVQTGRTKEALGDYTPENLLDEYLTGVRALAQPHAVGRSADVTILIVAGNRENPAATIREFAAEVQTAHGLNDYDGTTPVILVFHRGRAVKRYTYRHSPGFKGCRLTWVVNGLLGRNPPKSRVSAGGGAGVAASGPALDALVERLLASAGTTNAAAVRDATLGAGPPVIPTLRAALFRTPAVAPQARAVVREILSELDGPPHGAVVRGEPTQPSAQGLTDGDIITVEDGSPVEKGRHSEASLDLYDRECGYSPLRRSYGDMSVEFEVWRPDGTETNLSMFLNEPFPQRIMRYPDAVHEYYCRGALGPWDALVAEGLWKGHRHRHVQAKERIEEAFARGCRDPLALAVWIEALNRSGGFESVPFICANFERHLAHTGCRAKMVGGPIALQKSHAQFLLGERAPAMRIVDEALAAARAVGDKEAIGLLLPWRIEIGSLGDPAEFLAYAKANAAEVREYVTLRDKDGEVGPFGSYEHFDWQAPHDAGVAKCVLDRLLAAGRPDEAREFLDMLDPSAAGTVRSDMERQRALAGRHSNDLARAFWIPTRAMPEPRSQDGRLAFFRRNQLPDLRLTGPFRLDWTMRMSKIPPTDHPVFDSSVELLARGRDLRFTAALDRRGRMKYALRGVRAPAGGAMIGDPRKPHRFSLRVLPHVLRLDCDERPEFVRFFDGDIDPAIAIHDALATQFAGFGEAVKGDVTPIVAEIETSGCRGEISDIVVYAAATNRVDTDTLAKTVVMLERAMRDGNLSSVTQAWASLQIAYRDSIGDHPALGEIEKRVNAAIEGNAGAQERLIGNPKLKPRGIPWRQEGEWLISSPMTNVEANVATRQMGAVGGTMFLDNMELSGIIVIPASASNTTCDLHWNSTWQKDDNVFAVAPAAGTYSFGVWQDPHAHLYHKNRPLLKRPEGPIRFCIRARGEDAALFVESGDKPLAVVSGLKNQGNTLLIFFRNAGGVSCRLGLLRLRRIPMTVLLNSPAEMPELPANGQVP